MFANYIFYMLKFFIYLCLFCTHVYFAIELFKVIFPGVSILYSYFFMVLFI